MSMPNFSVDAESQKLVCGGVDVDLVQWLLELSAERYAGLDRLACLLELDRLAVACASQPAFLDPTASQRDRLRAINYVLFEVEGFHGNRDDYYDPRNSYLSDVLTRRTGLPIALSIVYMAVAARAGLRLFGANAPGHFVVGCPTLARPIFVDPFNGGGLLSLDACRRRIERVVGKPGSVRDEDFRPAPPRAIAVRVLRNLKTSLMRVEDWANLLPVQMRLAWFEPDSADERRDLGLLLLRNGQPHRALPLLEQSLSGESGPQAAALGGAVRAARKQIAEMN
jgi:regulator of sirC expression with transglutaminase-like and TPR domain